MVAPTASIERGSHRGAFGRSVGVDIPTPSRSKIMMRFLERENQINRNYKTLLDDEDFELGSGASENDSGSDSFHSTFDEDDIYDTFDEDDDLFDFNDDDDQIYAFGQSTFDEEGFYDDGSGSDFSSSTMNGEGDASKPIECNDEDQDREQDPKPEPKTGHGQSQEEEDTHVGESETLSALTGPSHTSVRRKKRKRKSRRRKPKIDFIYRTGALVDRMYQMLMTQSRTDSLSLRRRSSRRKNRKPKQREPDNTKADKSPTLSTLSLFKCFPDDFEDAPVKPLVVSKNLDDPYEQGLQHREGSGTTGTRDSNTVSLADSFSTEGSHPHEKNGTNKVIVVTEDASTSDPQAETTHEKPSTIEDASTNGNEAKEEANDATNNSEHIHSKPGRSHHESSSIFENCLCTEDFIDILPLAATNSFDVLSWKKGTNSEIAKASFEEVANNAPQEVQNDGEVSEEAQDQKNTTVVHEQSVPPSPPPPHSTKEEVPESVDKKLLSKWWKPCTTNVSRCHGCGEAAAPAAYALSRVGKLVAAANCGTVTVKVDENVAESDVDTALLQAEAKRISNNAMTIKTPIQKMLSLKKENTTIPDVNKEQEHFDVQKTKLSFPRDGDDNDSVFQIRILVEETENKDKNTENGGVPHTLNQDTSNNTVDRAYSLDKSIPCADVRHSVLKQDDRLQEEVPAPIVESIANAEELLAKSTYGPPSCEATISETACAGGETAAVSESQHHKDKTAPGDLDEERPTTAEQGIERTKEDLCAVLGSKERERATAGKNSRRPSLIGLMTKNPSQTKAKTPRRSLLRRRRSKESRKKNANAAAHQRIEPSPTGFEIEFSTPPSDHEGNTSNRVKRTRSQQRIVAAQRRHKGVKHAVLVLNNKTGAAVLSPTGGIAPERQRTYEDPLIFEVSRDPDGPAIDADEPATPPLPPVVPERARTLEDRSIVEFQRDPSSGSAEHRTIDADEQLREEATPEPEPTPLLRVETVVRKPRTAIEAATMPTSPESGKHSKKTQKKNSKSERQQSRNSRWYKRLKPPSRNKKLPITLVEDEGCEVFYAKKDRAIF